MADFSAVIRRAIDGLSANTPDERGRIYGRARATIQRQLDSLPEGMNRTIFEAQLVKIEDSILEIEQEYADAVPDLSGPDLSGQEVSPEINQLDEHSQQPSGVDVPVPVENEVASSEEHTSTPEIVEKVIEPVIEASVVVEDVTEAPEPEPVVEAPEVISPFTREAEFLEEDASKIGEDSSPTKFESFNSAENAIDSELQIPDAPQNDSVKPFVPVVQQDVVIEPSDEPTVQTPIIEPAQTPIVEQVDTPLNDFTTTDKDSNLIDQAVSEIRSTLQQDTPDKSTLSDPNLSFGFGEEALPEAPAPKQRKSPVVIVIAVLLLLIVALTFFFWRLGWQGIQDLFPQSTIESTEVSGSPSADEVEEQPAQSDQNSETATETDEVSTVSGEVDKFTQRLNSDGSEIDAGPASDLIDGLPNEEGRSVASADASDDTNQSEPITAQTDAGAQALQKMFFYETSLGLEQQARYEGSIVWSEKIESDSEKSRPYIEGTIQVPERDVSIVISIKLNGDETLPVSHLIDLNFSLPEEFDGGEIEQITEVKFKSSEEQTGDRLEAISAKIDNSFFVVGLQNDKLDVVESNLQLMSQRGWIDIPISYTNGRKALITLEKGASGKTIFDKVLASWKQNPVQ